MRSLLVRLHVSLKQRHAVALLVAVSTALSPPAVSSAAEAAHSSSACANVMFIGAAGSGELKTDHNPKQFHYMGPEVDKMASVMEATLGASHLTMSRIPDRYRADGVEELAPSKGEIAGLFFGAVGTGVALAHYKTHHLDKYLASIDDGVQVAVDEAKAVVANCPAASLVMAGYSQGAMVIHQAELQLASAGGADVLGHIAGTLLLADGDRVTNTRAKLFGTSSKSAEGVRPALAPGRHRDVPSPRDTANICSSDDIVCDFHLKELLHVDRSIAVHTGYAQKGRKGYSYSPLLSQAATWLASRIIPNLGEVIFDGSPGSGSPPPSLGPYAMTAFGADSQDVGLVGGVSGPSGQLSFTTPLDHELVGVGWQTWSNGYEGDVYVSDDSNSSAVRLPADTRAFYLYAEPNIFEDFNVSATTSDGATSGPVTVFGDSGAKYFGFYTTGGKRISEVTVAADDLVAIGEFGIAK